MGKLFEVSAEPMFDTAGGADEPGVGLGTRQRYSPAATTAATAPAVTPRPTQGAAYSPPAATPAVPRTAATTRGIVLPPPEEPPPVTFPPPAEVPPMVYQPPEDLDEGGPFAVYDKGAIERARRSIEARRAEQARQAREEAEAARKEAYADEWWRVTSTYAPSLRESTKAKDERAIRARR